jgi:hypothetical protein
MTTKSRYPHGWAISLQSEHTAKKSRFFNEQRKTLSDKEVTDFSTPYLDSCKGRIRLKSQDENLNCWPISNLRQ